MIALWGCPPHAGGYFLCGQKVTKKPPEPMVLDSFTRGRPNGTACLGGGFSDTLPREELLCHVNERILRGSDLVVWLSTNSVCRPLRTCIHNRGMLDGRVFFSSDKEIFRSNPDGLQGKATQYGGKKTGQTAFNGCEYRFLKGQSLQRGPSESLRRKTAGTPPTASPPLGLVGRR